jgi:DNA (cytosine-5)-methyltransferase 1
VKYVAMFAGVAPQVESWRRLGLNPLAFAEIDAFPSAVLAHHYPDVANLGDMTKVDWSQYRGRCQMVVGSPPCQAFSVAGLRKSLADERGSLSLEYVRAIDAIDPEWTITENVPGWLNTGDNAFGCFLGAMVGVDSPLVPARGQRWTDAGLVIGPRRAAAWRCLDAQYHGLAQRRKRVFVLSLRHSGKVDGPGESEVRERSRVLRLLSQVLFVEQGLPRNTPPGREEGENTSHGITPSIGASGRGVSRGSDSRGRYPVIAMAFGGNNTSGPVDVATACNAHGGTGRHDFESETFVTHPLRADGFDASEDGTGRGTPLVPVAIPILEAGARTASGGSSRSYVAGQSMAVRRLTPLECEILQGWTPFFTAIPYRGKIAADGPRYKAIGNGWSVPVLDWIAKRIMEARGTQD